MFLFTNAPVGTRDVGASIGAGSRPATAAAGPAAGTAGTGGAVLDAIRDGAQSSGVGFDYLLATAQRESGLDPKAKAATSSASGLFQFIEQTWLGTMKAAGSKLGLSSYADAITARSDGSFGVSDTATRQTILDLRRDPRVSAAMAGALTQRNREALGAALGREPTSGDLYAAHVLGAKGAATLIGSAQGSPARAAALDLPEAASANRGLFYDRSGRARSSSELYALLATSTAGGRPAVAGTATEASTTTATAASLPEMTTAYAALDPSLRSLFQTDRRQGGPVQGVAQGAGQGAGQGSTQGAVSPGVAKLWQSRGQGSGMTAAASAATGTGGIAPTYFPHSDASQDMSLSTSQDTSQATWNDTVREPETTGSIQAAADATGRTPGSASSVRAVVVPLPPRRPLDFAQAATGTAAPTSAQTGAARAALIDFSSYALRNGP